MSKAEKMKAELGDKVAQSTGAITSDKPAAAPPAAANPKTDGLKKLKDAEIIPIAKIVPDPTQPRKEFDAVKLDMLAASLRKEGQLQPIRVRYDGVAQGYVIIAGERRWRAAQLAELKTLDCIVERRDLDELTLLRHQMIENLNREDLSDVEKARAYRELMEKGKLKQKEVAEQLNISQSAVTRALALLDLPAEVQDLVHEGQLPAATAGKLVELERPDDQKEMAGRIVAENLNRDSAAREIKVLADQREDERIQEAANAAPDAVGAAPAGAGDGGGLATATRPKAKPKEKAKEKAKEKKKAKVKTLHQFKLGGYTITAERSKGIEFESLLSALGMAGEQIQMAIEDKARGKAPADPSAN